MIATFPPAISLPSSPLAVAALALVGWLLWMGLYPLRRWRYRAFPGPPGLPFLGNLPQIVSYDTTHYLSYAARKYGPICKVWFGTRPWLVVSDPELVRKLSFASAARPLDLPSYLDVLTGENRHVEGASAFFAHGETWRRGRHAFEASILHPASLAAHLPAVRHCLARFMSPLERAAAAAGASEVPLRSGSGATAQDLDLDLDIRRALGDLMMAIIGELAYGVDFEVEFDLRQWTAQPSSLPPPEAEEAAKRRSGALATTAASGGGGTGGGDVNPSGGSGGGHTRSVGSRLAGLARDIFEVYRIENASEYLPAQLMFPSLAPLLRLLAAALPGHHQRRAMTCCTQISAVSRQLMEQWDAAAAAAASATAAAATSSVEPPPPPEATARRAAAAGCGSAVDAVAAADGAAADVAAAAPLSCRFREVGCGISGSGFLADMLEGRRGAGARDRLSDREVIAQCITFILAAYDTSSTTFSLAAALLAAHPGAQAAVVAEVEATGGREVDMRMLQEELPYTDAVLKETMRLFPAVPMMHRHARGDIRLPDGRVIPRGTFLALSNYNLHHDPALWPQPSTFIPERHLNTPAPAPAPAPAVTSDASGAGGGGQSAGGGAALGAAHPSAWAGFGAGTRMCVGHKLAMMIGKATLVTLLRRFRLSPARSPTAAAAKPAAAAAGTAAGAVGNHQSLQPPQPQPQQPCPLPPMVTGLTYGPREGVWLRLHPRQGGRTWAPPSPVPSSCSPSTASVCSSSVSSPSSSCC